MDTLYIIIGIVVGLAVLVWLGLRIKPAAFPAYGAPDAPVQTVPLPEGLPAPVERFYRKTYGESLPRITSAVISGRGRMAPFKVSIPMRFRFLYECGGDYRARIEMTFFGRAFMQANETYIDGHAVGKMPTGTDEGPWFDDSMNLRVWCEMLNWLPAALLTDPRVRWDAVDGDTAILVVPFGAKQQRVIVRFDPQSGGMLYFEAMKYRNATTKMLWVNSIWFDQGKPWIHLEIEEKLFNLDVRAAIRASLPS